MTQDATLNSIYLDLASITASRFTHSSWRPYWVTHRIFNTNW